MLSNKKGQFTDILGGIQRAISWLLTTAPKPLLLILFLLFLVGFSLLIPKMINVSGTFCDVDGNSYRANSFKETFYLINNPYGSVSDPDSGFSNVDQFVLGATCVLDVADSAEYKYEDSLGQEHYLASGNYLKNSDSCVVCDSVRLKRASISTILGGAVNVCLGDASYKEDAGSLCNQCTPQKGYFYDQSENSYVCEDGDCVNTPASNWKGLLSSKATLKPLPVSDSKSYHNFVSVACKKGDVNPKILLFARNKANGDTGGLDVFDYKIWLFLIILGGLVWAVVTFKR